MTDQKPAAAGKPTIDVNQARSALKFFKIAAFIVGIGLLVLVLEMVRVTEAAAPPCSPSAR